MRNKKDIQISIKEKAEDYAETTVFKKSIEFPISKDEKEWLQQNEDSEEYDELLQSIVAYYEDNDDWDLQITKVEFEEYADSEEYSCIITMEA